MSEMNVQHLCGAGKVCETIMQRLLGPFTVCEMTMQHLHSPFTVCKMTMQHLHTPFTVCGGTMQHLHSLFTVCGGTMQHLRGLFTVCARPFSCPPAVGGAYAIRPYMYPAKLRCPRRGRPYTGTRPNFAAPAGAAPTSLLPPPQLLGIVNA